MRQEKEQRRDVAEALSLCKQSKEEIAGKQLFSQKDKQAFFAGLLYSSGSLIFAGGGISAQLTTQNEKVARHIVAVAESLTGRPCALHTRGKTYELTVENALSLLKACRVLDSDGGAVCEHISPDWREQSAAAFVRGAYLGSGSLSAGKYHLEFSFGKKTIAEDFANMLFLFGISARVAKRGLRAVTYTKDSASICDCLALMGAAKAVLRLNALLVDRQMNEYVNRQQNCDLHNLDKQIDAGLRQCAYLKELDLSVLSPALQETARARLEHPDYSYEQLSDLLGISKSGIKNRLRRLSEAYRSQNKGGNKNGD